MQRKTVVVMVLVVGVLVTPVTDGQVRANPSTEPPLSRPTQTLLSDTFSIHNRAIVVASSLRSSTTVARPNVSIVDGPPSNITRGETFSITYQITNTGSLQGSFTVEFQDLPSGITVESVTGDVQSRNVDGDPPTASTENVPAGETVRVTVGFAVSTSAMRGSQSVSFTANQPIDGTTDSVSQTLSIGTTTTESGSEDESTTDPPSAPDDQSDTTREPRSPSIIAAQQQVPFRLDQPVWRGQQLVFDASSILDPGLPAGQRTFQIRRIRGPRDNTVGSVVREVVVDPRNRTATIPTTELNGSYVLVHEATGYRIDVTNGSASIGSLRGTTGFVWTVHSQSLRATVDDTDATVPTHGSVNVSLDSNRNERYLVNISADRLGTDVLTAIWGPSQEVIAVDDEARRITVVVRPGTDLQAEFTQYDDLGQYTFTFDAVDSTASATASMLVTERDVTVDVPTDRVVEEEGDIATIPIRMTGDDTGWLFVYRPATGFLERVKVVDDGDGHLSVQMNLFTAGNTDASSYEMATANDTVATVTDLTSFVGTRNSSPTSTQTNYAQPLPTGTYELIVSASPDFTVGNESELTIPHTRGRATLTIQDRSTTDIHTLIAPMGPADDYAASPHHTLQTDDESTTTPTVADQIARGDRLLIRINASGVFGYLDDGTVPTAGGIAQTVPTPAGRDAVGLELRITPTGTPNATATAIGVNGNHSYLYTDPRNDSFVVVIDTSAVDPAVAPGVTYDVTFSIYGPANASGPFRGPQARTNLGAAAPTEYPGLPNPFVPTNRMDRLSTSIRFESPSVEFTTRTATDDVHLPPNRTARLTGRTNVAPGSDLTVQIHSTTPSPFSQTRNVTVGANGTIAAVFDLSTLQSGYDFTITVRRNGTVIAEQPGRATAGSTGPATTSTPQGQPGFGITAALVALFIAVGLVSRRR